MRQYRIKKMGNRFYPQYKNGWKTFWNWEFIYHPEYMQFKNSSESANIRAFFLSENEAIEFIERDRKNREVKYINI